jgi:hypothetical protein
MFDKGQFEAYFNVVKEESRDRLLGLLHLAKQLGDDSWVNELTSKLRSIV